MIKIQINKKNNLVKIYDYDKDVTFELSIEKNGEYYYEPEDMYYSSLTAFIENNIENPKPVEVVNFDTEFFQGRVLWLKDSFY